MKHGFVVEGLRGDVLEVADPYDNATRWGRAEPTAPTISFEELLPALGGKALWAFVERCGDAQNTPIEQIRENSRRILQSQRDGICERFVQGHSGLDRTAVESLAVQTWLLARSRALHAWWLERVAEEGRIPRVSVDRFAGEIAPGWQRASGAAYVALRRVQAGKAAPPAVLEAVKDCYLTEVALAADLLALMTE